MLQLQADNGYPKDLDAIMVKVKEQKYITVVSKKKNIFVAVNPYMNLVARCIIFSRSSGEEHKIKSSTVSLVLC